MSSVRFGKSIAPAEAAYSIEFGRRKTGLACKECNGGLPIISLTTIEGESNTRGQVRCSWCNAIDSFVPGVECDVCHQLAPYDSFVFDDLDAQFICPNCYDSCIVCGKFERNRYLTYDRHGNPYCEECKHHIGGFEHEFIRCD